MKIFIALGTQKFQFNRLLKNVDDLFYEGKLNYDVFAQIGESTYIPANYPAKKFLSRDEYKANIDDCDVLLTHAGVGTIIQGKKNGCYVIVAPRLAKFGEHIDDHQLEIARTFKNENFVDIYNEHDSLFDILKNINNKSQKKYTSSRSEINNYLINYLNLKRRDD
ncbi:MAG: PssE/Cps14G family polysaccharide biosynthesis glycosyltransferase [Liquorilactobacillus hordei]|uniref:PssE/Cps14G family polysaccharide biosynthesis glycosyltransferase n=1 Tax=Liquorilactobacillus hordei TaxID=468911 RepID=UPI0039ECBEE7